MTDDRSGAFPSSETPNLSFCLVPAYMAADKTIRGDELRVAMVSGGWSDLAGELIPLEDTPDVARVSICVVSDLELPPQALRVAIAIGIDVDAGGCFTPDMKAIERRLRPMGIDGRQIRKSLDAMIARGHIRHLASGPFQIRTNGRNFKPATEPERQAMLSRLVERVERPPGLPELEDDATQSHRDAASELMAMGYLRFESGDLVITTPGKSPRILSIDHLPVANVNVSVTADR